MTPDDGDLYGGISDIRVPAEVFHFGNGVTIGPTRAHFMRPCLMTFEQPEASFPAWRNAGGSFGFDIVAEIAVPADFAPPRWFDRANTVWWLAALLRLRATPRLRVPVLSNTSFSQAIQQSSPSFWPVESESERTRMLLEPDAAGSVCIQDLEWIKRHWLEAGHLMQESREFTIAFQAFDQSSFGRDPTLALLLLWAALETLFSPGQSELRFRVSANIATFLEPPGQGRALLQRRLAKLYDARSAAAHGRADEADAPLIETYGILKRVLLQIVEENRVPTVGDIEAALFGGC